MEKEFQMSDLGPCKQYLGMDVEDSERHIKLNQRSFIRSYVAKYNLTVTGRSWIITIGE